MQDFRLTNRVSAASAKQDLITLRYGNWLISERSGNYNILFEQLGSSPIPQRAHENSNEFALGEIHNVRVFRSVDRSLPRIQYIHVRSHYARATPLEEDIESDFPYAEGIDRGRLPLFRGRLCLNGAGPSARLVFNDLQLNPTRYLAYQPVSTGPVSDWPQPVLYVNRRNPRTVEEFPLGSAEEDRFRDNVLFDEETSDYFSGRNWQHHVSRYWAAVRECLDYRMNMAARSAGIAIHNSCSLALREVETYWEFQADNPISLVYDLIRYIRRLGANVSDRHWPAGYRTAGRDRNSPSVKALLRPGVTLNVYAKTSRRVRFEVRHDFRERDLPLRGDGQVERNSSNPHRLRHWLKYCAQDAAIELNNVFAYIERQEQAAERSPRLGERPYSLLMHISRSTTNELLAKTILELLTENGVIDLSDNSPLQRAVQYLQRKEVVERVRRHSRTVRLRPEYQTALQWIREGRFS